MDFVWKSSVETVFGYITTFSGLFGHFMTFDISWHLTFHDHWRLKYTEVQSQQMAFTQSPSVSNNPKIPTYYLIFAVVWDFMSFEIFCHLRFYVIWDFCKNQIVGRNLRIVAHWWTLCAVHQGATILRFLPIIWFLQCTDTVYNESPILHVHGPIDAWKIGRNVRAISGANNCQLGLFFSPNISVYNCQSVQILKFSVWVLNPNHGI